MTVNIDGGPAHDAPDLGGKVEELAGTITAETLQRQPGLVALVAGGLWLLRNRERVSGWIGTVIGRVRGR